MKSLPNQQPGVVQSEIECDVGYLNGKILL